MNHTPISSLIFVPFHPPRSFNISEFFPILAEVLQITHFTQNCTCLRHQTLQMGGITFTIHHNTAYFHAEKNQLKGIFQSLIMPPPSHYSHFCLPLICSL